MNGDILRDCIAVISIKHSNDLDLFRKFTKVVTKLDSLTKVSHLIVFDALAGNTSKASCISGSPYCFLLLLCSLSHPLNSPGGQGRLAQAQMYK